MSFDLTANSLRRAFAEEAIKHRPRLRLYITDTEVYEGSDGRKVHLHSGHTVHIDG